MGHAHLRFFRLPRNGLPDATPRKRSRYENSHRLGQALKWWTTTGLNGAVMVRPCWCFVATAMCHALVEYNIYIGVNPCIQPVARRVRKDSPCAYTHTVATFNPPAPPRKGGEHQFRRPRRSQSAVLAEGRHARRHPQPHIRRHTLGETLR